MKIRIVLKRFLLSTIAVAAAVIVGLQAFAESQTPSSPPKTPDLPKVYMPGLGEFMLTIQVHHAKMWYAARAGNWPLAEYQLSELKEVFSDVQDLVPTYKNIPVGEMVDAVVTGPIAEMEKAIAQKKLKAFTAAYDKLTVACNDCHKAGSRPFIHVRRPSRSSFDNEEFRPAKR